MGINQKFTRIPKVADLLLSGVPTEVIPTYCALADYSNNKTGLCWPKMETLAQTLNRSVRTIQRHLHVLKEKGLIEFVERRRWKGRYSSYTYKILTKFTSGHERPLGKRGPIYRRTKRIMNTPKPPQESQEERRRREAAERRAGYEWLFD